jgi:hypothetical protein
MPDLPMIVPCYHARYDPATGDSALLLQDLSETHHLPITRDAQLTPGQNLPAERDGARAIERWLRRYHAALRAAGVNDYGWEALLRDYRLAIVDWLLVPLQDCRDGAGTDYWWLKMECLLGAYQDWECGGLLEATTK